MLDCDQALEWISAHIDGCLTPEEEDALARHLEHCPACRSLLADLEQIHSDISEMAAAPVPPPDGLQDTIMAQIRRRNRPGTGVRWQAWAAAAAVLAVVLLGAGPLRVWRTGGSGAITADLAADAGGAAAPAAGSSEAGTTADAGGESQPASTSYEAVGDEAGKQVPASPVPPDTAVSSEAGASGGTLSATAPAIPSAPSIYQSQNTSQPAGGSQPGADDADTGAQPRAETSGANSLPQGYAVTPAPSPGADAATTPAGAPIYVGVLTLTWEQASGLEELGELPCTVQGDIRSYVLPAADFEALVQALNAQESDALRHSGDDISPDADQGLVLVTGVPTP